MRHSLVNVASVSRVVTTPSIIDQMNPLADIPAMEGMIEKDGWHVSDKLTEEEQAQLVNMLNQNRAAFAYTEADITGYHGVDGPCTIETHTDKPTISRPRRLGKAESAEVDKFYHRNHDNEV